eukprot:365031-Chlamydomonas_euryale.AAC.12
MRIGTSEAMHGPCRADKRARADRGAGQAESLASFERARGVRPLWMPGSDGCGGGGGEAAMDAWLGSVWGRRW